MFIFTVPKYIAYKMARKSNYILQKTFIGFNRRQFKTNQTKNLKNCSILDSKTPLMVKIAF